MNQTLQFNPSLTIEHEGNILTVSALTGRWGPNGDGWKFRAKYPDIQNIILHSHPEKRSLFFIDEKEIEETPEIKTAFESVTVAIANRKPKKEEEKDEENRSTEK